MREINPAFVRMHIFGRGRISDISRNSLGTKTDDRHGVYQCEHGIVLEHKNPLDTIDDEVV